MNSFFEDLHSASIYHKVRTCLLSEFIFDAADFSWNLQAFLKNYGKKKKKKLREFVVLFPVFVI